MADFNIDDFQTFDVFKRRQELANPPVSQAVLEARAKTEQMANDYNRLNQFVALATGRSAGAPVSIPSYSDGPTSSQVSQANEQASVEFMRSLEKIQEQLGRPLRENEIPAIAKAYGIGSKGLAMVDKYFKYIGRTEAQDIAAAKEARAKTEFDQKQYSIAEKKAGQSVLFDVFQDHLSLIRNADGATVANRLEEAEADIYDSELNPTQKNAILKEFRDAAKAAQTFGESGRKEAREAGERDATALEDDKYDLLVNQAQRKMQAVREGRTYTDGRDGSQVTPTTPGLTFQTQQQIFDDAMKKASQMGLDPDALNDRLTKLVAREEPTKSVLDTSTGKLVLMSDRQIRIANQTQPNRIAPVKNKDGSLGMAAQLAVLGGMAEEGMAFNSPEGRELIQIFRNNEPMDVILYVSQHKPEYLGIAQKILKKLENEVPDFWSVIASMQGNSAGSTVSAGSTGEGGIQMREIKE